MTASRVDSSEMARRIIDLFSDRQAQDIVLLDIRQVASFTDYFIIASAQNVRHMSALIDAVDTELAREGIKSIHTEGKPDSGWVLIDFGDVIGHIFTPADRTFYNLEGLWTRAGVAAVHFQ